MKKIFFITCMAAVILNSCKKTVSDVVPGSNSLVLAYPAVSLFNIASSGLNWYDNALLNLNFGAATDTLTLSANIGVPSGSDMTVNIGVDQAAFASYMQAHPKALYAAMPASDYTIVNTNATIKAGQTSTLFQVVFYPSAINTLKTGFLLPVSITSNTGYAANASLKTVYFHIEQGKPAYCTAGGGTGDNANYIVSLATAGAAHNINFINSAFPASGYGLFATDSISVSPSSSFTLNMTNSPGTQWSRVSVYVDWNNDGSFTDAGDDVLELGAAAQSNIGTTVNISSQINVPATAASGSTRMRVRFYDAWVSDPGPCTVANYTMAQDFIVHIGK